MSYWSKAYGKLSFNKAKEYHSTSLELIKKHCNKQVNLITDYKGEELFKHLGWGSIDCSLEDIPVNYFQVWCLGKLKAYNIIANHGDHFLHIDYDFFVFEDLLEKIKDFDVFFQSKENTTGFSYNVNYFKEKCKNKYILNNNKYIQEAYNCGIIGGKNLEYFSEYSTRAIKMIYDKENVDFWLKDWKHHNRFSYFTKAILAEQYYAQLIAEELNIKPSFLWNTYDYDPLNSKFVKEHKCIHLYGNYKNKIEYVANKFNKYINFDY